MLSAALQADVIEKGDRGERAATELDGKDPCAPLRKRFEVPRQQVFVDDTIALRSEYLYFASSARGLQPKGLRKRLAALMDSHDDVPPELVGRTGDVAFCAELARQCSDGLGRLLNVPADEVHLLARVAPARALSLLAVALVQGAGKVLLVDGSPRLPEIPVETVAFEAVIDRLNESDEDVGVVVAPMFHPTTCRPLELSCLVDIARRRGFVVGVEASDVVGNVLPPELSGVDFAVFSTDRYLCGGPDTLTGVYLGAAHGRAAPGLSLDAADGAWRTLAEHEDGALPIPRLVALAESLEMFGSASLAELADKSNALLRYMSFLLEACAGPLSPTLAEAEVVGSRPSPCVLPIGSYFGFVAPIIQQESLLQTRVVMDKRKDTFVASAHPLYTSFVDVYRLVQRLKTAFSANDCDEAEIVTVDAGGE